MIYIHKNQKISISQMHKDFAVIETLNTGKFFTINMSKKDVLAQYPPEKIIYGKL